MRKNPIGFNTQITEETPKESPAIHKTETKEPRKSVVRVYFPHRGTGWAYYNDRFDLKVGDFVYVEGKLEGYRGQVTEINYSFKIRLADYKKVVAVIDTDVKGDIYLAGSHIVSFDKNTIPFSKVVTWFSAPEIGEDYVIGNDDSAGFSLEDLSELKISSETADRGHDYYMNNKVAYVELNGSVGHAVVEGSRNYLVEFEYQNGEISNLKCSCFCSGACKHEVAAMLQLRETLDIILQNYKNEYNGYLAALSRGVFIDTVMHKKVSGKISLGG